MNTQDTVASNRSRRQFLKTSAVAVAGAGLVSVLAPPVHAAGSDTLKIALIGCGNRGTGALVQALSTNGPVKLWALADTFQDRLDDCLKHVERELKGQPSEKRKGKGSKSRATSVIALDHANEKIDCPKER